MLNNDWSDRPTMDEVRQAHTWRIRFGIVLCLFAFGVLCGFLAGGLWP